MIAIGLFVKKQGIRYPGPERVDERRNRAGAAKRILVMMERGIAFSEFMAATVGPQVCGGIKG
jgi:hypothetical protein